MEKTHVKSSYQHALSAAVMATVAVFAFAGISYADVVGTGVEVNIGANGGALVRGAKVTSVSGTTVNANTSLGSSALSWVVKTDNDTEFTANKNGASGIANIAVGDIISFRGAIDQTVSGLTVKAKVVKDWSSVETKSKLEGTVTSINATLNSFTVKHGNSTTTVQTSSTTKFKEDGDSASFADLVLNAKVKIAGMLNASTSVFTATSVDIDENNSDNHGKKEWKHWIKSNFWFKFGH